MTDSLLSSAQDKGRIWFFATGALCLLAGIVAITVPTYTSIAIAQIIGVICFVSGIFLLFTALFGKSSHHRILDFFSALLRLVLGVLFIVKIGPAVLAMTLFLASVFVAEGIFGLVFAFRLRGHNPAWGWVLANAIAALLLGGLLFAKFPSDAPWAIGLLFGINSLFMGVSLIMFGLGLSKTAKA